MKLNLLSIALLAGAAAPLPPAAAQRQLWIRQFGTNADDVVQRFCPDGAGGAFATGDTFGSLGGPLAGANDAWVARFDGAGNQAWMRQFGSPSSDYPHALAPDGAGGAYVAGETYGILGGTSAGSVDAWLSRYDSAGNRTWIRQFGTTAYDSAFALCLDGAGGAFAAGYTTGSLGGQNPSPGYADAWLARYDSAGNQTWIRQIGTSGSDYAYALCSDSAGGAYIAGFGDGDLGGPTAGSHDVWLARYDSAGNQTWIRQFGTSVVDSASALCPDGAGGVFVAGNTYDSLGGQNPNPGSSDVWLARYDSSGNRTWIRQFGTNAEDNTASICPDGAGGAFAAGTTLGNFGGQAAGGFDGWLARYDSAGNQTWICQVGTSSPDFAFALCSDDAGGAFVGGRTDGSLGGQNPTPGYRDAWLARYGPPTCYPNCDNSSAAPVLNVNDFQCFINKFAAQDTYANCDHSTNPPALNVNDFQCFLNAFAAGCP